MLREIGRNKGVLHVTKTDWQAKKFHIGVKKSCYVHRILNMGAEFDFGTLLFGRCSLFIR